MSGRPTDLDYSRTRAYCACCMCGRGLFGHFFLSSIISLDRRLVDRKLVEALIPPLISMLAVPRRHFCFVSSWFFFFFFFWLVSLLECLFVLYVFLALWLPALQYQLPALPFVCVYSFVFILVIVVFLVSQSRSKGEGWSTANKFKPPPPPPVISLLVIPIYKCKNR